MESTLPKEDASSRIIKAPQQSVTTDNPNGIVNYEEDLQDFEGQIREFELLDSLPGPDDKKVDDKVQAELVKDNSDIIAKEPKKEEEKNGQKNENDGQQQASNLENPSEQQQKEQGPSNPDEDRDKRSVFVKNVHFSADKKEIEGFFAERDCKTNNITILSDKVTRQPMGYCYIEFESADVAYNALQLNGTLFKGRLLTIQPKKKRLPGRGRARRSNPMMSLFNMMNQMRGGYRGRGRGGMDSFRGRGRGMPRGGHPHGGPQQQGERPGASIASEQKHEDAN